MNDSVGLRMNMFVAELWSGGLWLTWPLQQTCRSVRAHMQHCWPYVTSKCLLPMSMPAASPDFHFQRSGGLTPSSSMYTNTQAPVRAWLWARGTAYTVHRTPHSPAPAGFQHLPLQPGHVGRCVFSGTGLDGCPAPMLMGNRQWERSPWCERNVRLVFWRKIQLQQITCFVCNFTLFFFDFIYESAIPISPS